MGTCLSLPENSDDVADPTKGVSEAIDSGATDDEEERTPTPSPDRPFRDAIIVSLQSIYVLEQQGSSTSDNLRLNIHVLCEGLEGDKRGSSEWPTLEAVPGSTTAIEKPRSLNCLRLEGCILRTKITVLNDERSERNLDAAERASGDGRKERGKHRARSFTASGTLRLDPVPYELMESRKITLFVDGAENKSTPASGIPLAAGHMKEMSLNHRLLHGERFGELNIKFLPVPPRRKHVFFVRHAESEWNEAQRNKNIINMMRQVDHPLTSTGCEQVMGLQRKVARWAKVLEQEEMMRVTRAKEAIDRAQEAAKKAREAAEKEKAKQRAMNRKSTASSSLTSPSSSSSSSKFIWQKKKWKWSSGASKRSKKRSVPSVSSVEQLSTAAAANNAEAIAETYSPEEGQPDDKMESTTVTVSETATIKKRSSEDDDTSLHPDTAGALLTALRAQRQKALAEGELECAAELTKNIRSAKAIVRTHASGKYSGPVKSNSLVSFHTQDAKCAHLERRFMLARVYSSPLCRALQTAILALGPSRHPGVRINGISLLAESREVKKTRGSFDCSSSVTGDEIRNRAVALLAPSNHFEDKGHNNDNSDDHANEDEINSRSTRLDKNADSGGKRRRHRRGRRRRDRKDSSGNEGVDNNDNNSAKVFDSGMKPGELRSALEAVVVRSGDAGNEGIRWWTQGFESSGESSRRINDLMEHLRLLPEEDEVVVCHSHLIREIFRTFSNPKSDERPSTVAECCDHKLENCGVVVLHCDFGPIFPNYKPPETSKTNQQGKPVPPEEDRKEEDEEDYSGYIIQDASLIFGSSCLS